MCYLLINKYSLYFDSLNLSTCLANKVAKFGPHFYWPETIVILLLKMFHCFEMPWGFGSIADLCAMHYGDQNSSKVHATNLSVNENVCPLPTNQDHCDSTAETCPIPLQTKLRFVPSADCVYATNFGLQRSINGSPAKAVVNVQIGATFLSTRNHWYSTAFICPLLWSSMGFWFSCWVYLPMNVTVAKIAQLAMLPIWLQMSK